MANKASNQVTLIDLTDGYSVVMTNESHTFLGTTNSVSGTQNATTTLQALCGSEIVPCSVGNITTPNGLSVVSDGKTPSPTLTITATSALTSGGTIQIPVVIGEVTINKTFSYSIAFKGATGAKGDKGATGSAGVSISGVTNYYLTTSASSGVTTNTSGWSTTPTATTTTNKYIWMYQKITYSSGNPTNTTPVIIGTHGATGNTGATGKGISSITNYYLTTSAGSGVTTSTSGWSTTPTATTTTNKYLWSYQKITYTSGNPTNTTPVIIGTHGATGAAGAAGKDAIALVIESSGGLIFKNSAIATTLTAKVFKGGVEVTGSALTALGTIKWYKDGGSTAIATGPSLTIGAGDVTNSANYTAQLEG